MKPSSRFGSLSWFSWSGLCCLALITACGGATGRGGKLPAPEYERVELPPYEDPRAKDPLDDLDKLKVDSVPEPSSSTETPEGEAKGSTASGQADPALGGTGGGISSSPPEPVAPHHESGVTHGTGSTSPRGSAGSASAGASGGGAAVAPTQ